MIGAIIERNDGNFFMSRKRAMLLEWRRIALRRKHCYRILTLAITRTLLMDGFNGIRKVSRSVHVGQKHGKSAKKAI